MPAALAAPDPTRLGISAIGQASPTFDLSMAPGESRVLGVDLVNAGPENVPALTYAGDVYTLVNGGMGVALRGGVATGTTAWLDYATEVIELKPLMPVRRDFTVSVPPGAPAGDYITSLVVENQVPLQGSGRLVLNQVVRHALAVMISVPGTRFPALHASSASHSVVGGRSVISIAVENPGNSNLKPVADARVFDGARRQVSHSTVTMGSFYALTSTQLELHLENLLKPGRYTAVIILDDTATGLSVISSPLPFVVTGAPPAPALVMGPIAAGTFGDGFSYWVLGLAMAVAILAGGIAVLVIQRLWRRRPRWRRAAR
ncbi:MAG TPA: hypothetical protein VG015_00865 [Candidatus Dormibacteraeota bacterium]|jgi:hypothetical protein|nr:hypothetical protein [Candidatus Dormibacteraeota bacterium]